MESAIRANLKTWPATPVEASLEIKETNLRLSLAQIAPLAKEGAAGVGRLSEDRCQTSDVRCQVFLVATDDRDLRVLISDI